jgi:hypothetical protein
MFGQKLIKPAILLVLAAVMTFIGINACSGKTPSAAATPKASATATAGSSISFTTAALAVGDTTGLATEVYALKLSKSDEMIKYAGMYSLTSDQFNLVDRYNDEYYADKLTLLLLVGGPATARFEVRKMVLEDGQLVVRLNEVVKSIKDKDVVYRGIVVEVNAADVKAARTAVVQLHMEIG